MINAETFLPHHRMSHVLKPLLQAELLLTGKLLTFLTLQSKAFERQLLLCVYMSAHACLRASPCVHTQMACFAVGIGSCAC